MSIDLTALPEDVETLHALIGDLVRERDSARAEAEAEIARLRGILKTALSEQLGVSRAGGFVTSPDRSWAIEVRNVSLLLAIGVTTDDYREIARYHGRPQGGYPTLVNLYHLPHRFGLLCLSHSLLLSAAVSEELGLSRAGGFRNFSR